MATAHLIHGYLGAGKTTFARQLERELPAIRFSQDEWMAHLYGNDPPPDEFPIFFRRISELIGRLWPRCLELGVDVILDLNFWSREERDEIRAVAATLGACSRLYRLACPEDEAWRRVEKRNLSLDGSLFISRNTFEFLKSRFEPLGDDERESTSWSIPRQSSPASAIEWHKTECCLWVLPERALGQPGSLFYPGIAAEVFAPRRLSGSCQGRTSAPPIVLTDIPALIVVSWIDRGSLT